MLRFLLGAAEAGFFPGIILTWCLPSPGGFPSASARACALFGGSAAAVGIVLVAAIGNLGGFAGPAFTGIAEDTTGGFEMPLTVLGVLLVAAAALTLRFNERSAAVLEPAAG